VSFEATQVWYASDRRARSPYKILVYDDIGSLSVRPHVVEFRGQTTRLSISPVNRLERARQSWNWVMYLVGNLAMSPVYAFWWYVATWFVAAPGKYVIFSVLALNLIAWALGRSVTWIVATGSGNTGQLAQVWFAAGANQGWAGMFGATARMHQDALRALQQHAAGPPNQPAAADGGRRLNER
jgi:hypothetical protein